MSKRKSDNCIRINQEIYIKDILWPEYVAACYER